jgi:hypothetical protein
MKQGHLPLQPAFALHAWHPSPERFCWSLHLKFGTFLQRFVPSFIDGAVHKLAGISPAHSSTRKRTRALCVNGAEEKSSGAGDRAAGSVVVGAVVLPGGRW